MFNKYNEARRYFVENHDKLINVENYIMHVMGGFFKDYIQEIVYDYNEASYLYPFWKNYPQKTEEGNQ